MGKERPEPVGVNVLDGDGDFLSLPGEALYVTGLLDEPGERLHLAAAVAYPEGLAVHDDAELPDAPPLGDGLSHPVPRAQDDHLVRVPGEIL